MKLLDNNIPQALRGPASGLAECLRAFGRARPIERVVLFGSYARGEQRADSDVDLCIVAEGAENQLAAARLSQQLPGLGTTSVPCEQAGRRFDVSVGVFPTPNPDFRRIDAHVFDGNTPLLRVTTIVGRY